MFNIPLIGAMAPTPDLLPKKKRDWRASLFDRLNPDSDLGEADKSKVGRQALLGLASGLLGTGGGFGNALSAGLQQGLLSMNQGADDVVNDRYRQAMMQRTMDGADRNSQIEAARSKVIKPDGTLDQAAWIQYVALDPEGGKQIRDAIEGPQTRWQLGRIGDGMGGEVDVLFDPVDPSKMRTIDGQPIGAGLLGDRQAPAAPQFGILRDAVEQVESGGNPLAVSTAGAIGPMQTMPGTLRDPGFGVAPARDGSIDEQRRVGNDYLSAMLNKYADPRLALAAYNAGPGRVDQAMAAGGGAEAALSRLPQETRDYVPKVLGRAGFAQAQPGLGRRPAKSGAGRDAPSGYQWTPEGTLAPIPGGPADRKNNPTASDLSKAEMQMRKEVTDRVKDSRSVMTMYQKVQGAASKPSAANDLAMIFAYMKMLDPGSVVREQEFANAQNAAGIPDQVRNAYNKALRGERLNPEQRNQFLSSARQIADIAGQQITDVAREYQTSADEYGYDTRRATGLADFRDVQSGAPAVEQPDAPAPKRVRFNPRTGKLE